MFNYVTEFEKTIANFYNAPYAVATDCCTHAIELCLRLKQITKTSVPKHTYLSIPMTLDKLSINYSWNEEYWENYYYLGDTNIIDAAVYWKENGYISNTMMCLSFQYKKHLNLGRGGCILLDNVNDYKELIKMSYDGRTRDKPWAEQDVTTIGYHYYMTPETALLGIEKFYKVSVLKPNVWDYSKYPDLSKLKVFEHVK